MISNRTTNRRRFLELSAVTAVTELGGCLGDSFGGGTPTRTTTRSTTTHRDGSTTDGTREMTASPTIEGPKHSDDLLPDPNPDDGYPPQFEQVPDERPVDTGSFRRLDVEGTEVPLAPIEATYYWYTRGEARFVDARGRGQYETAHVYGAVLSTAPDGVENDPVDSWPRSDRIVCYCGCPHHLSSLRAASLIDAGYGNVFVIDEGFWEWQERGYPMGGSEAQESRKVVAITGRTESRFAGETAWASHTATDQHEAAAITANGSYDLHLRFSGVTDRSTIRVRTPAYTVEATLGALARGSITPDGQLS